MCPSLPLEKRQTYNLIDWIFSLPAETFQIQMDPLLFSINYLSSRKYIIEFSYFGRLPLSLQDYWLHWPALNCQLLNVWIPQLWEGLDPHPSSPSISIFLSHFLYESPLYLSVQLKNIYSKFQQHMDYRAAIRYSLRNPLTRNTLSFWIERKTDLEIVSVHYTEDCDHT